MFLLIDVFCVLPEEQKPVKGNILIDEISGKIISIDNDSFQARNYNATIKIVDDYRGCYVFPGFIDPHVHFRTPSMSDAENFTSGSKAALSAGVTTVFDMPNTNPPTIDKKTLEQKSNIARKSALINIGLFAGLTKDNLEEIISIDSLKGIKVYLASTTGNLLVKDLSELQKEKLSDAYFNKIFIFHAEKECMIQENLQRLGEIRTPQEHSEIRNEATAISSTRDLIELQKKTNLNFHIAHVSTSQEVQLLLASDLSFEVCAHHIFRSVDDYNTGGFKWKCNPPLRSKETSLELLKLLHEEKIPMIATDHAPHPLELKMSQEKLPPSGVPSLEVATHLVLNELYKKNISFLYASKVLSSNAARRLKLEGRGKIQKDFHADLAIVDMNHDWVFSEADIYSGCGWSPFVGEKFNVKVLASVVNGQLYATNKLEFAENLSHEKKIYII